MATMLTVRLFVGHVRISLLSFLVFVMRDKVIPSQSIILSSFEIIRRHLNIDVVGIIAASYFQSQPKGAVLSRSRLTFDQ